MRINVYPISRNFSLATSSSSKDNLENFYRKRKQNMKATKNNEKMTEMNYKYHPDDSRCLGKQTRAPPLPVNLAAIPS